MKITESPPRIRTAAAAPELSGGRNVQKNDMMKKAEIKYNMDMKNFFLSLLVIPLILCACNVPGGKEEDMKLATQVGEISTSIYATMAAEYTDTPAPTDLPTAVPTETPTVALFIDPTEDIGTEEASGPAETENSLPIIVVTEPAAEEATPIPVETRIAGHFQTRTPLPGLPTQDLRPVAARWREWPVVPEISDTAADIYWYGVKELGTNPRSLSRIGDCHSEPGVFMGIYDTDFYSLADEDLYLTSAIDFFKGSFDKISYSVHAGMSAASVLTTIWADPYACQQGENTLECEIRINNPSIMFVNLGSNWVPGAGTDIYYDYLSEIVQTLLDHGILPILSSKADNVEGDNSINEITAQVARDFDIPFFNFWAIAQYLPDHGLDPKQDGVHLSVEAWNWRNYHALRTLYAVGKKLELF